MTVEGRGGPIYSVLSSDTKPIPIEPTALLVETDTGLFFVWDGAAWIGSYALTPVLYDAIVDGIGTKTGHYAEITNAISAGGVNIFVKPKPAAGRYNAFTVAAGDAARSIVGAGPGVLVGAFTINKDEVIIADLESNGRVTLRRQHCKFDRIICRNVTGNTGFTMSNIPGDSTGDSLFTDCKVLGANAGIAFDFGDGHHGIIVVDFVVRDFTGQHVIFADFPDHSLRGLNLDTTVVPTQEPMRIDGPNNGQFLLLESDLGCVTPNTFNTIKVTDIVFLLIQNLSNINSAADATPAIHLDHTLGLYLASSIGGGGVNTLFDIPVASTALTILSVCVAAIALVTGTGNPEIRSCKQGAAVVNDRYDLFSILPMTDNTRLLGSILLRWAQMHTFILAVSNYQDFRNTAAPANPPMVGPAQASRMYTRAIDANNDGLFIKIKQAGVIVEVQIV